MWRRRNRENPLLGVRGYRLASAERTVQNVPDSGGQVMEGQVEDFEMDSPGEWRASRQAAESSGHIVVY